MIHIYLKNQFLFVCVQQCYHIDPEKIKIKISISDINKKWSYCKKYNKTLNELCAHMFEIFIFNENAILMSEAHVKIFI